LGIPLFFIYFITLGTYFFNPVVADSICLFTEALGNNAGPSTSPPPASERKCFADVTRLGFASAQDSPPLRVETVDANGKNESVREQGMIPIMVFVVWKQSEYHNLISVGVLS
jgi:hypothetical protein